jgi:hypothetical protein
LGVLAAGIAAMAGALERGDVDEAARQGAIAGPAAVEQALASRARLTRLAGSVAAPAVEGRAELMPALAAAAAGPDRRTAIPAATSARVIARELARSELPDDLAPDDLEAWRAQYEQLARTPGHFVEVRRLALDTASSLAHALDPDALGFELAALLADPDPALRALAVALVPRPTAAAHHAALAGAVVGDADPEVALGAAKTLCGDLDRTGSDVVAVHATLGAAGLDRIRALVAAAPRGTAADAARCLSSAPAP